MDYAQIVAYVELHKLVFRGAAWTTPVLNDYSEAYKAAKARIKQPGKLAKLNNAFSIARGYSAISEADRQQIQAFINADAEVQRNLSHKKVVLEFRDCGKCWGNFKCLLESRMAPDSKYTLTEAVRLILTSFTSYLQKWCKSKSMTMKDIEHIWMIRDEDMQVLWEKAWKYDDYIRRNPHMARNFCQDVPHDYEWIMDNVLDPEIGNMHGRYYGIPAPISKLSIVTEANPELVYKPEPTPQPAQQPAPTPAPQPTPQPIAPDSGKAPVTPTTSKAFSQLLHDIAPDPEPSTPAPKAFSQLLHDIAPDPEPGTPTPDPTPKPAQSTAQRTMLGVLNRAMAGVPKVASDDYEVIRDEEEQVVGVLHSPSNQAIPLSNYAAFEKAKEENEYSEVFSSKDGEWVGIQLASGDFLPRPSTVVQWENV